MSATSRPDRVGVPPPDGPYGPGPAPDPTQPVEPDASLGELLNRLTHDFSSLVTTQVELAKVEIKEEVATAGRAAGLLGGGAFCAYLAVVLLAFAAAWGLSEVVPEGVAFLIVAVVFAVAAAVLIPKGKQKLTGIRPGEHTAETVKEDVQWAREQMS